MSGKTSFRKTLVKIATVVGIFVLVAYLLLVAVSSMDIMRFLNPGLYARFGHFGGVGRSYRSPSAFKPKATLWGIRWYPTYVHFGPDDDTLLVTLCHAQRDNLCRIAKYSLARDHWEVLPFDERRTYYSPLFSPDGQWIYYSATEPCDKEYLECKNRRLYRMRPDGRQSELAADIPMWGPRFSVDGKRIIYWGGALVNKTTGFRSANPDVFYYDLETRQEVQLTNMLPHPSMRPVFLTPDGEHFIFAAPLDMYWTGSTSCAVDPQTIPADPQTGWKTYPTPLFGEKEAPYHFLAAIQDAPIGLMNCYKLQPLWSPEETTTSVNYPCAMDGKGRVLYPGSLPQKRAEGNPFALALRPPNPNYRPPPPLSFAEMERERLKPPLTEEQTRRGEGASGFMVGKARDVNRGDYVAARAFCYSRGVCYCG